MIDFSTFAEDNADLLTKKLPLATVKNLQTAMKMFLQIGEIGIATSIFDTIKLYFRN